MSHSEHKEKDIQFHADIAAVYDYLTVEPREYANEQLFRQINKGIAPGELMIDLGCGTGHMLQRYGGRFQHYIGIDHSADMLAEAHKKAPAGQDVALVQSDVDEWLDGYAGQAPDFVTAVGFLHHLEPIELASAVARFHALLAPGGRLLVAEPIHSEHVPARVEQINRQSILNERLTEAMPPDTEDPDEEPLQEASLIKALDQAGFKRVVTNKGYDILHREYPPGLMEKFEIWRMARFAGAQKNGDVIAVLAEK